MTSRKRARGKRRKQREQGRKTSSGGPATGRAVSSAIMMVGERIATAGPDYFEDNFIRVLQGCAALRQEPEFANLYFEPEQTLEALVRHFPRFERRLNRAARRGTEAGALVYDDYRIAVLDDLDSPQFRRQLQRRLGRCVDRLKYGHDTEKFESALFVSVLLSDKANKMVGKKEALPLGVYGLVTTIYEDSFDRAMKEIDDARDVAGGDLYNMWCAKRHREDMEAITAATEQVSAFEELATHIETNPALALAWERQEGYLIEEFESKIAQVGLTFTPSLFTSDEVALTMDKMEQRYLNKPWSLSRHFAVPAMFNFACCIQETLDEIVSPQRMAEMIVRFKSSGQKALVSDNDQIHALVPHIQAAIHHLHSEQTVSRNRVVRTMYMLSFTTTLSNTDTLSPPWQQFVKRLVKSRFLRRMGGTAE